LSFLIPLRFHCVFFFRRSITVTTKNLDFIYDSNHHLSLLSTCLGGQIVEGLMQIAQDLYGQQIINKILNSIHIEITKSENDVSVHLDSNGCLTVLIAFEANGRNVMFASVGDYLRKKLATELELKRFVDPTKAIPKDLLMEILNYLSPTDRKNCAMVSKVWYELWISHRKKITKSKWKKEKRMEHELFFRWYSQHKRGDCRSLFPMPSRYRDDEKEDVSK
jgi:hypothetical protein